MDFGFLGHALTWLTTHVQGMKKGTRTAEQIEAAPIVQAAVHAGEQATQAFLAQHLAKAIGFEPSPAGVAGFLTGLVDNAPQIPSVVKEPLKIYLGGLLGGSTFYVSSQSDAPVAITGEAPLQANPTQGQGG